MDRTAVTPDPDAGAAPEDAARCPFPHAALAATDPEPAPEPTAAGRCPVPHGAAATCPVDLTRGRGPVERSAADRFVWKVLRIHEPDAGASSASAYSAFQKSMTISALRCTLTYVIFPIVLPLVGIAKGIGPIIGVFVGSFAIGCDVFTIRRFFSVDHRWRWYFSAIALSIISLLMVLLVQDWVDLLT